MDADGHTIVSNRFCGATKELHTDFRVSEDQVSTIFRCIESVDTIDIEQIKKHMLLLDKRASESESTQILTVVISSTVLPRESVRPTKMVTVATGLCTTLQARRHDTPRSMRCSGYTASNSVCCKPLPTCRLPIDPLAHTIQCDQIHDSLKSPGYAQGCISASGVRNTGTGRSIS